eukprot:4433832-Prorocentrum_lima.AAC.1
MCIRDSTAVARLRYRLWNTFLRVRQLRAQVHQQEQELAIIRRELKQTSAFPQGFVASDWDRPRPPEVDTNTHPAPAAEQPGRGSGGHTYRGERGH